MMHPNGNNEYFACLNICTPKGMPMMVIHITSPLWTLEHTKKRMTKSPSFFMLAYEPVLSDCFDDN